MKVKAHIRVGKDRRGHTQLTATTKPSLRPLSKSNGTVLPTVAFAVEFDVPDSMFKRAEDVIATVTIQDAEIAAEVREVTG